MTTRKPRLPSGTKAGGERLWRSVVDAFDLDEHELALLRQAVRTVDVIDALDAAVARDGVVVKSPQGEKAHPALVEARQQRLALARLLAALRMPSGDEEENRPQRRQVRGVYTPTAGRLRSVS